jgi:hypothetical protein
MARSKRSKKGRKKARKQARSKHRPLNVLKHFSKRKAKELKELDALIKRRGG